MTKPKTGITPAEMQRGRHYIVTASRWPRLKRGYHVAVEGTDLLIAEELDYCRDIWKQADFCVEIDAAWYGMIAARTARQCENAQDIIRKPRG